MERARFEHLLDAYGADVARWPAAERAAGAAFAERHAVDLGAPVDEARSLDAMLNIVREPVADTAALAARVLAAAPVVRDNFDKRALWALAACAVFGVVLGYGGGVLAPTTDADDTLFVMAFEAPFVAPGEDG